MITDSYEGIGVIFSMKYNNLNRFAWI